MPERGEGGVVAHNVLFGVSHHPGRFAATPPHEEGNNADVQCADYYRDPKLESIE